MLRSAMSLPYWLHGNEPAGGNAGSTERETGKWQSTISKLMFEAGDTAGATAQLQSVLERANEDELKQIARIRLAEIQLDAKQYDDALRTLDARRDEPFAGVYEDLRGDILAAAGRVS